MSKPDALGLCFRCEYCQSERIGYWNEYVCTFNGDDDSTVFNRLIKRLDKCPKETDGEQE